MYKLYNVRRWGSMSAHFLLDELEMPYENIWLSAEQVSAPQFRKVSPLGLIPALGLADGHAMFESAAIVSFLTAAHPDKGLAPGLGTPDYGMFLAWLHFMSANVYQTISLAAGSKGFETYAHTPEQRAAIAHAATDQLHRQLAIIEGQLKEAGPFMLGESYSALDPYLFMLTTWALPSEREVLAKFPAIARLASEVRRRPKLQSALEAHGVMQVGAAA